MLKQEIWSMLEKADYDVAEYSGCFDIIAKRSDLLLLKVLENVDSLQKEQAENLKILSKSLVASPAVIGRWTRTERLYDDVIYERFDIPAFTPRTLESILIGNTERVVYRFKGGIFAEVSPEKLRRRRLQLGITQEELARKARVTKKNIYEHEKNRMLARYDSVKRLERLLGDISEPARFWDREFETARNTPKGAFEKTVSKDLRSIGFGTDVVYQSPFNIIAQSCDKRNFLILSDAESDLRKAEKNGTHLLQFAEVTEKHVLMITKRKIDVELPVIEEREIRTMTKRDVIKVVKDW